MDTRDANEKGEHQNIARAAAILAALAEAGEGGLRLADVVRCTSLGKTSCHRALAGLLAHGLVDQDPETGGFFLGLRMLEWAAGSTRRYGLFRFVDAGLERLAAATADTVYFSLMSGGEAVCVDRREGSFPIKTLTLRLGDRRPLGVGAGSLALLAALPEADVEDILHSQRGERGRFGLDDLELRRMVGVTQERGYALVEGQLIPGMSAVGVALRRRGGQPVAAISVAAISSRLDDNRRAEIAKLIQTEIEDVSAAAQSMLTSPLARLRK